MTTESPFPMPPPRPPGNPVGNDKPFWGSILSLVLSSAALYFGLPITDPGLEMIGNLVAEGFMALSGVFAAVRALVLHRRSKS